MVNQKRPDEGSGEGERRERKTGDVAGKWGGKRESRRIAVVGKGGSKGGTNKRRRKVGRVSSARDRSAKLSGSVTIAGGPYST